MSRPPHFALIGGRGIPNRYGGYETLMEELAPRLVERGFRVTVYCRSHATDPGLRRYRGVELVVLPTIRSKHLDTPAHTLLSCLHAAGRGFDAALMVNGANAIFVPMLQAAGLPVALHVDGIERQRAKWGPLGRAVYRLSERLSIWLPDRLITDAEVIRSYYLERHRADSLVIAYGVEPEPWGEPGPVMSRLGLESRGYFLYVSRFEPENNPHRVVEAYRDVGGDLPLVMVGGAAYGRAWARSFMTAADPRVVFPGPIYGDGYRELLSHALAYVQATEVGGTHPALVEAMGYGNCVLVNDTPENREVAGEAGLYFRARQPASLTALFEAVRADPGMAAARGAEAARSARQRYSWDAVTDAYAELLCGLAGSARGDHLDG